MLKIRLTRTGKKKQPSYRVVVADKDAKRDGRIVERIGHYNPLVQPAEYRIQEDRALYWLSVGAQPTDAVRRLLEKQGTIGRLQRFHAGEPMEALVAEYTGVVPTAVASAPTAPVATIAEEMVAEQAEVETAVVEVVEVEDMADVSAVEEPVEEVATDASTEVTTEEETVAEDEIIEEEAAEEETVEDDATADKSE